MFQTSGLVEAKDQKGSGDEKLIATVGPLSLYARSLSNVGPLERETYKSVLKKVYDACSRFGVPDELISGKLIFDARKSPLKGSIGEHDPDDDVPVIFDRNDDGPLTLSKLLWTVAHELGHRVWRRLSKSKRDLFTGSVEFVGKKLSDEVLNLMRDQAKTKKKILDDRHHRLFDSLWWVFKLDGSKDPDEFYRWIKDKKITLELPTEYAQVNDMEAWAETFADLVLGRKKTKKSRRTGRFLRSVVRGIIDSAHEHEMLKATDLV